MTSPDYHRIDQDRDRIDVSAEHECLYWTQSLGLSYSELREVVMKVGPLVKNVKEHLGR